MKYQYKLLVIFNNINKPVCICSANNYETLQLEAEKNFNDCAWQVINNETGSIVIENEI